MDEGLHAFLGTLVEIRAELGEPVYEAALERARIAVAHEVMVEAERRAIRTRRRLVTDVDAEATVVAFPRSCRSGGGDET